MKKAGKSTKPTLVLNRSKLDGFIDFNSAHDLARVMKVLKKLMKE
jgi:hypothetical protein